MVRCVDCGEYGCKLRICPKCGGRMKQVKERMMRDNSFWNGHAPKGRYPTAYEYNEE